MLLWKQDTSARRSLRLFNTESNPTDGSRWTRSDPSTKQRLIDEQIPPTAVGGPFKSFLQKSSRKVFARSRMKLSGAARDRSRARRVLFPRGCSKDLNASTDCRWWDFLFTQCRMQLVWCNQFPRFFQVSRQLFVTNLWQLDSHPATHTHVRWSIELLW